MIQLRRRTVALVVVAFLAVAVMAAVSFVRTLTPAEAGAGFTDTPPWVAAHAQWLKDNGITNGFDDGTFRPRDNLTRGQAAYWFGNYNDQLTWQNRSSSPAASTTFSDKIGCPNGGEPVAGGGYAGEPNVALTFSQPVDDEWEVKFESISGASVVPGEVLVWALCRPADV